MTQQPPDPVPEEGAASPTSGSGSRSSRKVGRAVAASSRIVAERVSAAFSSRGQGFYHLAGSHAGSVAGDTLVAMALAGTLFFAVPSTEARENVALYLLITLAPFAILGPVLGVVYERFPAAYRGGMVISASLRAGIAVIMIAFTNSLLLFPLAFALLVLSRFHGISRSSVLPTVLTRRDELVAANAHLARLGVLGSAIIIPIGSLAIWLDQPWLALLAASGCFVWSAISAHALPALDRTESAMPARRQRREPIPRPVRLARFATAGVRFLNGFLLLLVAFAFRDADAGFLDFGFLLGAGGAGFFLAALATPVLERRISEEPMVVAALAVEAAAAFITALAFGLVSAAVLAAAAGFAWGTAKFGFDGLLQATVTSTARGRAFTNSETIFQIAWVIGALIPVVPVVPVSIGLAVAGSVALVIQVVYVATLIPIASTRRAAEEDGPYDDDPGVLDLL